MAHTWDLTVSLAGPYYFGYEERAIEALEPLLHLTRRTRFALDLGGAAFMGPATIALIVATLNRLEAENLIEPGSTLIGPKNRLLHDYLVRTDVFRQIGAIDVPQSFTRRRPAGFRPCLHFASEDDYYLVAKELTDALAESCASEPAARASLYITLSELTENVLHHAYTELGGYAAVQALRRRPEIEIAIVDLGIGIPSSLARNPTLPTGGDDGEAIATALRPRITSTPDRNSGLGLSVTSLLLASNGGWLQVRSGRGLVVRGAQEEQRVTGTNLPGTLVVLRVRTDCPLEINAVYRQLDQLGIPADD